MPTTSSSKLSLNALEELKHGKGAIFILTGFFVYLYSRKSACIEPKWVHRKQNKPICIRFDGHGNIDMTFIFTMYHYVFHRIHSENIRGNKIGATFR